jgi:hypothetical protein
MFPAQQGSHGGGEGQGRNKGRPANTIMKVISEAAPTADGHLIPHQRPRDDGYVGISINRRTERAHCAAWAHYHRRRVPRGRVIRHYRCRVRACIAAGHLRASSQRLNVLEALRDGTLRLPHGIILSPRLVRQLRRAHAGGATFAELARQVGVRPETVRAAVRGRSWAWIGGWIR